MGIQFKGLTMRGVQIKGAEFLTPLDIATCKNWYKWKEGITVDGSNRVSNWADSGGSENISLSQGTSSRRPLYNPTTGSIYFDGTRYMLTGVLPVLSLPIETTIVLERPTLNEAIFSRSRSTGVDADAVSFAYAATGRVTKSIAVGTGLPIQTVTNSLPAGKHVLTFRWQDDFFVDGVICKYTIRTATPNYSDVAVPRWWIGGQARFTSGVPTIAINMSDVTFYEFCCHNKRLSTLERTKLVNYFKIKHEIS